MLLPLKRTRARRKARGTAGTAVRAEPRERTASCPFWARRHGGQGLPRQTASVVLTASFRKWRPRGSEGEQASSSAKARVGAQSRATPGDRHSLFARVHATGTPWARHAWGAGAMRGVLTPVVPQWGPTLPPHCHRGLVHRLENFPIKAENQQIWVAF